MQSKFAVHLFLITSAIVSGIASDASSQVVYQSTSFESVALAVTDAGDEYAYIINRADEVGSDGTYTYSESGTAPGYSSSASVGVEHDSSLSSSGFHLTGQASGYVADDYGYAACSANSESLVYLTFTLTRTSRDTIAGSLGLTGSSLPGAYSNTFELRRANGQLVSSSSGIGSISYSGRLRAGTYSVYVASQVLREIDFSGGDVYENSTAFFDVTMSAR